MNKTKIVSFLSLIGIAAASAVLVGCGNGGGGNLPPKTRTHILNCYARDYTYYEDINYNPHSSFANWVSAAFTNHDYGDAHAPTDFKTDYYKGYVGTGDVTNAGPFKIVDGSETVTPGQDVDITIELDPLVVLNPVVGEPLEYNPETIEPYNDYPTFYPELPDNNYCKVYMSDDYSTVGFLPSYCYTFEKLDNSHWHFHLSGEYTAYSYDVLISASYLDARQYLGGHFNVGYQLSTPYEFLWSTLTNDWYDLPINSYRVGDTNFKFAIKPFSPNSGATVTQEFIDSLIFRGYTSDNKTVDITEGVTTSLVDAQTQLPADNSSALSQYLLLNSGYQYVNCAIPFINYEKPANGIFTVDEDGYHPNYYRITVAVDSEYSNGLPIASVDEYGIDNRIHVSEGEGCDTVDAEVCYPWDIWDYTMSYPNPDEYVPYIHFHAEAEEGYYFPNVLEVKDPSITPFVTKFKLVSANDQAGEPYIHDININKVDADIFFGGYQDQDLNSYPSIIDMFGILNGNPQHRFVVSDSGSGEDDVLDVYVPINRFVGFSQLAYGSTGVDMKSLISDNRVGSYSFFKELDLTFSAQEIELP